MHVKALRTHRIEPGESLTDILDQAITTLSESDIVVITSKIISLCQNRIIPKDQISKYELVCQEADLILDTPKNPYDLYLTIKNGVLIPSAAIDESNVNGVYVLCPDHIPETAALIWNHLRQRHQIKNLGVVITDSRPTLMRRGVNGIALGWCGFEPLYSYIQKPDLYDQPLRVTQINLLDALATSAVFVMGEGAEQTPIAIIQDAPKITFMDRPPTPEEAAAIFIPMEEDLYGPLLMAGKWVRL